MKTVKWLFFNVVYACLLFWGVYEGHDWAFNIGMFLTWLGILFSFVLFWPSVRKELPKDMLSVPIPVNASFDVLILLFFIANGFFVTGALWFIRTILINSTYKMISDREVSNVHGS